jgi:hypothetical protein
MFDPGAQTKQEFRQRQRSRGGRKIWMFIAGSVVIGIAIFAILMIPAMRSAGESARRMALSSSLKNIVLGMHNYNEEFGTFPPAYVADENGKPMHSWRVLMVKSFEEPGPWQDYDLSQPWDSPKNLAIAAHVPGVFQNPYDRDSGKTCFVMVAGQGGAFEGTTAIPWGPGLPEVVVVENSREQYVWTEPVDVDIATLTGKINSGEKGQLNSRLPDGVMAGHKDGSVGVIPKKTAPEAVKKLFRKP